MRCCIGCRTREPDLAGYAVMMRSTTSPVWEREIWVGNVTTYTIAGCLH